MDLSPSGVKVSVYRDPGMWGWGRETASVSSGPQPLSTQATQCFLLVTRTVSVHSKGPHASLFPNFTEDPHPECSVTLNGHSDHRSEMEPAVGGLASASSGEETSLLLGGDGTAAPQGGGPQAGMWRRHGGGGAAGGTTPQPRSPAVCWELTPDTCIGCPAGREGSRRGRGCPLASVHMPFPLVAPGVCPLPSVQHPQN